MAATESNVAGTINNAPYYSGDPVNRQPERWKSLPYSLIDELNNPKGYRPDKGLIDAVNVALTLGQPLLLTGEPGTGKTQLAYSIAYELGFDTPYKFETKSTTEGRDLFYSFDTLGRFHAASHKDESIDPVNFITYNALGMAIIRANPQATVADVLPPTYVHPLEQKRSIVLIDEVDKAPREVPNDILNEIESMYFRIPELGHREVRAETQWQPVVIITSNSEKALPDAFLRRCVYYNIPFPPRELLQEILNERVGKRLHGFGNLLDELLDLFYWLREPRQGLQKKPGTAEILSWTLALGSKNPDPATSLKKQKDLITASYHVLFKNKEDHKNANKLIDEWAKTSSHRVS